jgi:hypothetical protein
MNKFEIIALIGISGFALKIVFFVITHITDLFFSTKNKVLIITGAPIAILGFPFFKFVEICIYMTLAQSFSYKGKIYIYLLIAAILVVDFLKFQHKYQKIVDRIKSDGYFYDSGDDNQKWLMRLYYTLSFIYFILVVIFPAIKWQSFADYLIDLLTFVISVEFIKIAGIVYTFLIILEGFSTVFKMIKFQKYTENKLYF